MLEWVEGWLGGKDVEIICLDKFLRSLIMKESIWYSSCWEGDVVKGYFFFFFNMEDFGVC